MTAARHPPAPAPADLGPPAAASGSAGDLAFVGSVGATLQIVGEALAEAIDLRADEEVLDVAAGTAIATLAAARRHARVTATDRVPARLEGGRLRALAEGLPVQWERADADALPFPDRRFDVVLSAFGSPCPPDRRRAAGEMLRVLRPHGRIGLTDWTPDGFVGRLLRVLGRHHPPADGRPWTVPSGTEARLAQLFGSDTMQIRCARRSFRFRYRSPSHWLQVFRAPGGPLHDAFAALPGAAADALARDVGALLVEFDVGGGRGLVVPSEYLEAVITRR